MAGSTQDAPIHAGQGRTHPLSAQAAGEARGLEGKPERSLQEVQEGGIGPVVSGQKAVGARPQLKSLLKPPERGQGKAHPIL